MSRYNVGELVFAFSCQMMHLSMVLRVQQSGTSFVYLVHCSSLHSYLPPSSSTLLRLFFITFFTLTIHAPPPQKSLPLIIVTDVGWGQEWNEWVAEDTCVGNDAEGQRKAKVVNALAKGTSVKGKGDEGGEGPWRGA